MNLKTAISILMVAASSFVGADEPDSDFAPSTYSASASVNANAGAFTQQQLPPAEYPSVEANSIEGGDNSLQALQQPSGFGVQTGYEGYLVPESEAEEEPSTLSLLNDIFPEFSGISKMASSLMSRGGNMLYGTAGAVGMVGVLTTAICAFTPLCTITFLGLARENVRSTMRSYMTQENVDAAASFIREAYEKYQKLNNRVNKRHARKPVKK